MRKGGKVRRVMRRWEGFDKGLRSVIERLMRV